MKKLLCVAAVAALCVPAMGATLQLSIQATPTSALEGEPVLIEILGEVVGASDGLALWSTNLLGDAGVTALDLCTPRFLDAPAGDMESFKRNLGLTNPGPGGAGDTTGYAGTCSGAGDLWQIGGGLNTIFNTGPTLYPIDDTIPTDVAVGGAIVLASGTFNVPTGAMTDIVLTLDSPFANVIVDGSTGPVYAVEEADVTIVQGTATIEIGTSIPPVVTDAWSFGYHAGAVMADLGVEVFPGGSIHEPRSIDATGRLYLVVTLDKAMAAGAQSVTTNPGILGVAAAGDGSADVVITFPTNAPLDETCYQIDLAGSVAVDGGIEEAGNDFCVCYNEADVDRSGAVNAGDKNLVVGAQNFFLDADVAADLTADIDRSGSVNAGDKNLVVGAQNFFKSPTACP